MTSRDELTDKTEQRAAQQPQETLNDALLMDDMPAPGRPQPSPIDFPLADMIQPPAPQASPPSSYLAGQQQDLTPDYIHAEQVLYTHLGKNELITPDMVRPIAKLFVDKFAEEEPAMLEALGRDANALMALTDDDIAQRIANGETLAPETGDILDVVADIAYDAALGPVYERFLQAKTAEARQGWNSLLGPSVVDLRNSVEQEARRLAAESDDPNANLFADMIGGDVTWAVTEILDNPTIWQWDGDDGLVFDVVGGDGNQLLGLKLDPGTKVETSMDAIKELILAKAGLAHEMTSGKEEIVNRQGFISKSFEAVAVAAENSPIARAAADTALSTWQVLNTPNLHRKDSEDIAEIYAQKPFTSRSVRNEEGRRARTEQILGDPTVQQNIKQRARDMITVAIAQSAWELADADLPPELNPDSLQLQGVPVGELVSVIEETLRSNPEVQDLITDQSTQDIVEEALTQLEEQTVVGEAIEEGVEVVFEGLAAWDRVTQTIAVNVVDFLVDSLAVTGVIDSQAIVDTLSGETTLSEGQEIFMNMLEETNPFQSPEAENVADYFSLEAGQADLALLAAGVVFDPFNYLFGGPKFTAQLARKMITDPKYAPLYVKTFGRNLTNSLWKRSGDDGLRVVASIGGHTPDSLRDMVRIARLDKSALTRQEVEDVIIKHLPSTDGAGFITLGPADRARTHLFANAVADMVDQIPLLDADTASQVWQSLAKLTKTRSMNLQPTVFIDEFLDLVVTARPGDSEFLGRWMNRLADTIEDSTVKRQQWQASAQARLKFADDQARALGDELDAIRGVDDAGGNLDLLSKELDKNTELLARARRGGTPEEIASLKNQKATVQAAKRSMLERQAELSEEVKIFRKEVHAAERELKYAQSAGSNEQHARLVAEFHDELAQRMPRIDPESGEIVEGLAVIGQHRDFPDLARYDWQPVRGLTDRAREKGVRANFDEIVSPTEGLVGSNADLANDLDEIGLFNHQSVASTPVSPYEIVVYERIMQGKMSNSAREKTLSAWRNSRAKERMSQIYGFYRKLFSMNLLLNLTTPIVTNADEVVRFWAVTGNESRTLRALAAPFGPIGDMAARSGNTASRVAQYQRDVLGDLVQAHNSWDWVPRPTGGRGTGRAVNQYVDQVERFVNGQVMQDDILREWAFSVREASYISGKADDIQWLGDLKAKNAPERFRTWWEDGLDDGPPGNANYRTWRVDAKRGKKPFSTDEVFQRVDNGIRSWLDNFVDPEMAAEFKEALIEKLTTGQMFSRTDDARFLKSVKQVPGKQAVSEGGRLNRGINATFDTFYGKPGQRRGAIFYDHFYDEHYNTLRQAYEAKGTLLTPERLMEKIGETGRIIDGQEAQAILRRGFDDPALSTLARGGFVTDDTLQIQARRMAERRSDELMYSLASGSLWGETGEVAFPFLRAQTDFLAWWWKHMTSPSVMRLGPEARGIPGIQQAVQLMESVPLNVRAAAKYSHMAAVVNNNFNSETPGGFDWAVDTFTFFPLENSGDVMMDIMPTPLGLPSWMGLWMVDNTETVPDVWRELAEDIWPALQWQTTGDMIQAEMLFPASERSMRNMAGVMVRGLSALMAASRDEPIDPMMTNLNGLASYLSTRRQPTGTSVAQGNAFIDFLRSDEAGRLTPSLDNEEWVRHALTAAEKGAVEATVAGMAAAFKGQVKLSDRYGGDAPQLKAYEEVINQYAAIEQFLPKNLTIEEGGQPRLLRVWEEYQQGTADEKDVNFLADSMATLMSTTLREQPWSDFTPDFSVRDYLIARDPGLAINTVSKLQVVDGLKLQGGRAAEFARNHEGPDGRLVNIPPGEAGLEVRSNALNSNWIIARPSVEWMSDVHGMADSAKREAIKSAWLLASGKEWSAEATFRIDNNGITYRPGLSEEDSEGNERRNLEVVPPDRAKHLLDLAGVDVEDRPYTLQDLRVVMDERLKELAPGPFAFSQLLSSSELARQVNRQGGAQGQTMLTTLRMASNAMNQAGMEDPEDWPEPVRGFFRDRFIAARDAGWLSDQVYINTAQRSFGPLDWEPPEPPPEDQLQAGYRIDPDDVDVSDGDTLVIPMADGDLRVRLMGINAPETGEVGADLATESLLSAVRRADTITIGWHKPEIFGVSQVTAPGVERLIAWLYINGVPVYDENVFTPTNQTGAALGGSVVDVWELYERRANG